MVPDAGIMLRAYPYPACYEGLCGGFGYGSVPFCLVGAKARYALRACMVSPMQGNWYAYGLRLIPHAPAGKSRIWEFDNFLSYIRIPMLA